MGVSYKLLFGLLFLTLLSNLLVGYYMSQQVDSALVTPPAKPDSSGFLANIVSWLLWIAQYIGFGWNLLYMTFTAAPAFIVIILGLLNVMTIFLGIGMFREWTQV